MKPARFHPVVLLFMMLVSVALRADDGMWLLNQPPLAELKSRYGFDPGQAWFDHVQKSAVRFNNGGSGSFASADGLIITNHHVAHDAIYKLSTKEHDYVREGFYARTLAEELRCVDLELNVLWEIENVTDRVNAAVPAGLAAEQARAARAAAKAAIEKESFERTGLRSDVVTLYQGAQYHLYRYKRYTDVRLVFAPEEQAAFFGGDPDNFEYPRYNLDFALVRAYENGVPVKAPHFLRWNPAGVAEGDLVFLAGHPGSTQRLITLAELEFARDIQVPLALRLLKSREVLLGSYAKRSEENYRRAQHEIRSIENSRKVYDGRIVGLLDPALVAAKRAEEESLRRFAADQPVLGVGDAWDRIAVAQQIIAAQSVRQAFLETQGFNSTLFGFARKLVRAADERAKPNGERLPEYRDSARTTFELGLFSGEPVYEDFETLKLTHALTLMAEELGANDPVVLAALGGQAPDVRAAALVHGTKLREVAARRALYGRSAAELAQSDDAMISFARAIDGPARAVRKLIEAQGEVKEQAHARIAKARYAKDGDRTAPDATFTLRLSFGTVQGIAGADPMPAFTTLGGIFTRAEAHRNQPPFDLPASWPGARARLNLDTPFNFITTCYCIGGNSGSPTVNRAGEFVGIVFDGNIDTLVWNYVYSDRRGRALSVDVRAILEAMRKIYGADALAAELTGIK